MNLPSQCCQAELETCGSVKVGLHSGALWRCPACGREYSSMDGEGGMVEIKALYMPSMPSVRMDIVMPPDFQPPPIDLPGGGRIEWEKPE
jgi:hypothetical protein